MRNITKFTRHIKWKNPFKLILQLIYKRTHQLDDLRFFKSVFTNMHTINLLIDPISGKIVKANDAASKFYGYTLQEMTLMRIDQINILPLEAIKQQMELAKNNKTNFFNFKHRLKGGEIRDVQVYSNYLEMSSERYVYSIITDVTEKRLAEERYRQEHVKFQLITEESMDGIVLMDLAGRYIYVNRSYREMTGFSEVELLRMSVFDLRLDEDDDLFERTRSSGIVNLARKRLRCRNGSSIMLEVRGKKIAIGKEEFMLGIMRDVTDKVKGEQEIIKAKEKAEESNKLKTQFLLNMSHEIRTPINAIKGFSELLMNSDLSRENRLEYASIIIENSTQLVRIIEDILMISALETSHVKVVNQNVSLAELLKDMHSQFGDKSTKKGLAFSYICNLNGSNFLFKTDLEKLNQILYNLLSNALKFTEQGFVELRCHHKDKMLEFSIKDTGIGIDPYHQDRIFEPFFQVERGLTRNFGGNGLGLSISKGYIELLGGKITVQSELGKGSEFSFTIPCKSDC